MRSKVGFPWRFLVLRKENSFTVAPPFRAALAGLKPSATSDEVVYVLKHVLAKVQRVAKKTGAVQLGGFAAWRLGERLF